MYKRQLQIIKLCKPSNFMQLQSPVITLGVVIMHRVDSAPDVLSFYPGVAWLGLLLTPIELVVLPHIVRWNHVVMKDFCQPVLRTSKRPKEKFLEIC